jgi:hypothetical protein
VQETAVDAAALFLFPAMKKIEILGGALLSYRVS